jgi:hypothetical protein
MLRMRATGMRGETQAMAVLLMATSSVTPSFKQKTCIRRMSGNRQIVRQITPPDPRAGPVRWQHDFREALDDTSGFP